jgi:hypothetical protein
MGQAKRPAGRPGMTEGVPAVDRKQRRLEEQYKLAAQHKAEMAAVDLGIKIKRIEQLELLLKGYPSISDAAFAFLEATVVHWEAHQEVYEAILTGKAQLQPQAIPWAEDVIALGKAIERLLPRESTGRLFYATASQTAADIARVKV